MIFEVLGSVLFLTARVREMLQASLQVDGCLVLAAALRDRMEL